MTQAIKNELNAIRDNEQETKGTAPKKAGDNHMKYVWGVLAFFTVIAALTSGL